MKDNQNHLEEKLSELPRHSLSKSTQDHMHQQVMNALNDVEVQQKGSRILMKKIQIGIASSAAIVLFGILSVNFILNNENHSGEQEIKEPEVEVEQTPTPNKDIQQDYQEQDQKDIETTDEEQVSVEQKATAIYNALRNRDMDLLSSYVHSEKGLFLSLSSYLQDYGVVFEKSEVSSLLEDDKEYTWGIGEANMELIYTPKDYMDRFLKPDTFLHPDNAFFDSQTPRSDLHKPIEAAFPGSKIVEFYKETKYEDWKSVYLVFEPNEHSIWELVAIISNEWTP
ncbi:hypothetical protein [Robertmurraya kyonggiensis]|uniref:Uncharacterized protein n=1 Tax=Robertmurraya kyonggiensis TaxID=1037680 RepID=A0A4U1CX63_9BACI|nr:hypothetical protein [Robertmurraya kyonggiensis]TKC14431.1 hypothetical protein FA727_22000 [Robertmurraya kyonggiensis]